jgi:hypothetical protein
MTTVKKLTVLVLGGTLLACSSGETYPPPISDCDGSCQSPIVTETGPEAGSDATTNDASADDASTDDTSTDDATDETIVDTGVSE